MALWMEKGSRPQTEREAADLDAIAALKESAALELKVRSSLPSAEFTGFFMRVAVAPLQVRVLFRTHHSTSTPLWRRRDMPYRAKIWLRASLWRMLFVEVDWLEREWCDFSCEFERKFETWLTFRFF